MRRWKIARTPPHAASSAPLLPTAKRPAAAVQKHKQMHSALLLLLTTATLACCGNWLLVAGVSTQLTNGGDPMPVLSKPLLEILHPTNDLVIGSTDLHIEVAIRAELHGGFRDAKLCISMDPVFIPADVELEDGTSQLQETCFEQAINYTTFHVDGLVPGLAYGITAGLISHSRIVGMSMRTFEVGSIALPEVLGGARMSVAVALDTGATYHNAGERMLAASIYRQVLDKFPEHPYALHLLGLVFYQDGNPYEGYAYIQRALQRNASENAFHNSLGLCLKSMGRVQEAVQSYRRALEIHPFGFQTALNLGDALQELGKWEDAMHEYRKVVASAQSAQAERFLKDAWRRVCELTRLTEGWFACEKCIAELLTRWPSEPEFHNDRGSLLLSAGQFEAALTEFESAQDLASVNGMVNVADVLESLGETEESLQQYQLILRSLMPMKGNPETRIRIMKATVLPRILPETQEIIDIYRRRFESEVDSLCEDLEKLRRTDMDPARISFSTAITMNAHNRNNRVLKEKLGSLYADLLYKYWIVRENYILTLAMAPLPYRLLRHRPYPPPAEPRRLRVGFVSRHLYNPMAGLYVSDLIRQFDSRKYETVAFAVGQSHSMTKQERLEQIAETVHALPKDLTIARNEIRAADIDVLIFPELGMDKTTYFLSLSRLAPVQAAWWGNADTSGVKNVDYRLVSEYEHEDYHAHYSERTYQFKGMGFYHRFAEPHDYNVSREQVRGAVMDRFGLPPDFRMYLSIETKTNLTSLCIWSLWWGLQQSILNMHPDFDYAVGQILRQDEKARIFLLGSSNRNRWRDQLVARIYANAGSEVAAGRIYFLNDVDAKQELLLLGAADAVLASIHLTRPRATIQAFTAGVPVVTFPGELWGTRIAYGFYRQMDMYDLVAGNLDEYVALVLRLAQDTEFRFEMGERIKERRIRLHEDAQAVEEWEKFFDFAGAKLYPTDDSDDDDDSDASSGESEGTIENGDHDSGEIEGSEEEDDLIPHHSSTEQEEERLEEGKEEL